MRVVSISGFGSTGVILHVMSKELIWGRPWVAWLVDSVQLKHLQLPTTLPDFNMTYGLTGLLF